ncbi:MAG TPA: hypothetical protein PLF81_27790 [Candidatus Anammoximicrobium sp.]|nr:hypothetical protein [Candidatus Anammoximicrobium sp.]
MGDPRAVRQRDKAEGRLISPPGEPERTSASFSVPTDVMRVLVRFPHTSGLRGKKRPALIVQSDAYAGTVGTLAVAEVAKNLTMADDTACLLIDTTVPEGTGTDVDESPREAAEKYP